MSTLDEKGREIFDQTPLAVPVRMSRYYTENAQLRMAQAMRQLISEEREGFETFADFEDFDVPDDVPGFDGPTPYEEHFDHLTGLSTFSTAKEIKEYFAAQRSAAGGGENGHNGSSSEPPPAAPEIKDGA